MYSLTEFKTAVSGSEEYFKKEEFLFTKLSVPGMLSPRQSHSRNAWQGLIFNAFPCCRRVRIALGYISVFEVVIILKKGFLTGSAYFETISNVGKGKAVLKLIWLTEGFYTWMVLNHKQAITSAAKNSWVSSWKWLFVWVGAIFLFNQAILYFRLSGKLIFYNLSARF